MKLSLKIEYACRVLAQLARTYGSSDLSHIDTLAEAEDIPANYLVQILNELRNGGLILSRRGKQGGYALAKPPQDITLYDIVRIVDADLLDWRASDRGQSGPAVSAVWNEISDSVKDKSKTFNVLQMMNVDDPSMYYI